MAVSRGSRPGVPTEASLLMDMLRRIAALERASSSGSSGGGGGGGVLSSDWQYNDQLTPPPGDGGLRFDADPNPTEAYISTIDKSGLDQRPVLEAMEVGNQIVYRNYSGETMVTTITSVSDDGDYFTFGFDIDSGGGTVKKNEDVTISFLLGGGGGGGGGGFTFFQSATPTANEVGDTWFDTNNGRAKVWDGFLWVEYALYPGGDTATGDIMRFTGGGDATLSDGTGSIQLGADGGPNIGIDGNEIVARDGSGNRSLLWLNETLQLTEGNGGAARLALLAYGADANNNDESGYLQIGASGGTNVGYDNNEIVPRDGSGNPGPFYINGSLTRLNGIMDVNQGGNVVIDAVSNDALEIHASGNRAFIALYGGNADTRCLYIGYTDPSTNTVNISADKGPLKIEGNGSVRSSTIYGSTANDWGVFIEANGTLGRTASTLRVKTNVENLTGDEAAEILADFDWVRFNYIDEETGEAKDSIQFGGIAEWLHEKRPEFVGYDDEDRPAAIRYNAVWPLVARVTQAQQDRIDSLEATVAKQGEQIAALTARLDALG